MFDIYFIAEKITNYLLIEMASIVCIPFAFMVATVVLYYFAKNLPVITSTPSDDNR